MAPPNYNSIALAGLILACIAVFFSMSTDIFLLYEYSVYVDFKNNVKKLMRLQFDATMIKAVITAITARAQENERNLEDLHARLKAVEEKNGIRPQA